VNFLGALAVLVQYRDGGMVLCFEVLAQDVLVYLEIECHGLSGSEYL
jgi:hypothetical protein